MAVETANALSGYFQTLYDLNHDLITLCGLDVIDNSGQYEKYIKNVIQAVPRLVPYDYDVKNQNYRINRQNQSTGRVAGVLRSAPIFAGRL